MSLQQTFSHHSWKPSGTKSNYNMMDRRHHCENRKKHPEQLQQLEKNYPNICGNFCCCKDHHHANLRSCRPEAQKEDCDLKENALTIFLLHYYYYTLLSSACNGRRQHINIVDLKNPSAVSINGASIWRLEHHKRLSSLLRVSTTVNAGWEAAKLASA